MNRYLLDTNIVSLLSSYREPNDKLLEKFYALNDEDEIMVSVITLYEVQYGLKNSNDEAQQKEIQKNIGNHSA